MTIKNHSVKDGTLLTELFKDGHVLYGLNEPVHSAVFDLKETDFKAAGGWDNKKMDIFYQGQMTDGVWLGRSRPTKYSSDAKIKQEFNDDKRVLAFKEFLNSHPRYNVRKQDDAKRLKRSYSEDVREGLWKRTSKAGLEFQLLVRKAPVHFLMDDLEIEEVASKQGNKGQSVTASELRWLYRHRELLNVKENLFFYKGGKKISHAEVFGRAEWQTYSPKERSCQLDGGRRSNGVFGALGRYIRSKFQ